MDDEHRTTAIGLLRSSRDYRKAAELIMQERREGAFPGDRVPSMPLRLLLGHSWELLLKAGLREKGYSLPQLRRLSHDLCRLWASFQREFGDQPFDDAIGRIGIWETADGFEELIGLLSDDHSAPYRNRYIRTGLASFPNPVFLCTCHSMLDRHLDPLCLAFYRHVEAPKRRAARKNKQLYDLNLKNINSD